ncbi:MAG: transcriptional repressor [Erysipelotrichaceae bacterium]|nr:transcriptional repressor [Erysipelotrichaceae bacterium]
MEYRQTKQRQAIYDAVRGKDKYMSAYDVYDVVKKSYPNIALKTVYRNLNFLCEQKLIAKIVNEGQIYFDGNPEPHYHLHCIKCDRYYDVDLPYDHKLDELVAQKYNAKIDGHQMIFEGICSNCLEGE